MSMDWLKKLLAFVRKFSQNNTLFKRFKNKV